MAIIKIKEVIRQTQTKTVSPKKHKNISDVMKQKQIERKQYIADQRFSGKGF